MQGRIVLAATPICHPPTERSRALALSEETHVCRHNGWTRLIHFLATGGLLLISLVVILPERGACGEPESESTIVESPTPIVWLGKAKSNRPLKSGALSLTCILTPRSICSVSSQSMIMRLSPSGSSSPTRIWAEPDVTGPVALRVHLPTCGVMTCRLLSLEVAMADSPSLAREIVSPTMLWDGNCARSLLHSTIMRDGVAVI
jgi:hypothetical protein